MFLGRVTGDLTVLLSTQSNVENIPMSNKKKYQEIYQAAIFLIFDVFNKCGRQWVAIQKNIYLPWIYE